MLDNEIASQDRHERFVERVIASGSVWGLRCSNGWAICPSNKANAEETKVMLFWSDRAYAKQCAKEEWSHYEPAQIPIAEFTELWLPGLDRDGLLVGTNWSVHLIGLELEPLILKAELGSRTE